MDRQTKQLQSRKGGDKADSPFVVVDVLGFPSPHTQLSKVGQTVDIVIVMVGGKQNDVLFTGARTD